MVRALLDGRKTQTRREIRPQPMHVDGGVPYRAPKPHEPTDAVFLPCRYGKSGDRLWVRETWREREPDQDTFSLEFRADRPEYKTRDDDPCAIPWRPSIHMPRAVSRITLEVTGVRVERLQDISEADARAEGVEGLGQMFDARTAYAALWQSIHGPGSWAANPWVWCVEFKRLT